MSTDRNEKKNKKLVPLFSRTNISNKVVTEESANKIQNETFIYLNIYFNKCPLTDNIFSMVFIAFFAKSIGVNHELIFDK